MKKSYSTTNRKADESFEGAEPIVFQIDDDQFTASPPTSTQFALLLAVQSERKDVSDKMAGLIDFVDGLLSLEDRRTFRRRLLDRDDRLDLELVEEILEDLIEEWAERPTEASSASISSRRRTGPSSTAKQRSTA